MQDHGTGPAALRWAAGEARKLAAYILNAAEDRNAYAALALVACVIRDEAVSHGLDELRCLAESVLAVAEAGHMDAQAAAELDAAVDRISVLTDWASPPGEWAALSPAEDAREEDRVPPPASAQVGSLVRPPFE